jgi:hypothetical protein
MTILLEHYTLPEQGTVELHIHRTFEIKVTAEQARRQVNRWLFMEVSCMMGARTPWLVVGERVVWRVPAVLTASHVGEVGVVGEIDVDVQTGAMDITPERIHELQGKAIELGKKMPPYPGPREVPVEYLAKNYRPTHPKPAPDPALIQKVTAALAAEEI